MPNLGAARHIKTFPSFHPTPPTCRRASSGQLSGIGVEVGLRSDPGSATSRAEVLSVVPGGPADRAGVAAGDTIMSIDGRETGGLSLYSIGKGLLLLCTRGRSSSWRWPIPRLV